MTNQEQENQSTPTAAPPVDFSQVAPLSSPQTDRAAEIAFVERLQQGEQAAWNQLVEEHGPRLQEHLKAQLPTDDDVADVLSETFMGLVQTIRTFDNRVHLSTFLYAIAHRKVADYWKRRRSREGQLRAERGYTTEGAAIQALLDEFPEAEEYILLLRYQAGLSLDEIACHLGLQPQSAATLLQIARRKLQTALIGQDVQQPYTAMPETQPPLLVSIHRMLVAQQQQCLQQNMTQEATLFQRAIWFLQDLSDVHTVRETIR